MMAPGYEQRFGFPRGVAIGQRPFLQGIDRRPDPPGIGIDESTAIVVQGGRIEVIGESKVAIYDKSYQPGADGKRY